MGPEQYGYGAYAGYRQRDAGIPVPREAQQAPEVKATPQSEPDADDDFQPEYGQSVGSKGHGRGKCTPCTRVLVRPGCEYGARCMFCHLEHSSQTDTKKSRHRPCKAARQQYKQTIQILGSDQYVGLGRSGSAAGPNFL
ncbi:C3H1-type domain-containing protein [Durusdinium trenchii]|uniref:C3H1-type domain-containing protein n=1 Tax=Durusdinium trenchii TaxID=1381693 RepID=A0ABP0PSG2_9DINO